MDERLSLCLWMAGCGGMGCVLGGAFGGMSAAFYARDFGAAGTRFGRWVAESLDRTAERKLSSLRQAIIIGAADGFLFLGIVGTLTGAAIFLIGKQEPRTLGVAVLAGVLLVGAAITFGVLAYTLTRQTLGVGLFAILVGLLCAILGRHLLGFDYGGPVGFILGFLGANAFCFLRRYAPRFHPPSVGEPIERARSDSETDMTASPNDVPAGDAFRKPHSKS